MSVSRRFGVSIGWLVLASVVTQGQWPPADADLTVQVTSSGAAVAGATVTITGSGTNVYVGLTGPTGSVTFPNAPTDTYIATAAAPGTTVGTTTGIPAGGSGTVTVTPSATIFSGMTAFGATAGHVIGDGRSGVFYMITAAIPPIYRTADHGATWAPVTISSDDRINGIDGGRPIQVLATSGYPGEVAAVSGNQVYFSRDFGVTWRSMLAPVAIDAVAAQLLWGHAPALGSDSMLFVDAGPNLLVANMSVSSPTLAVVGAAASYKTSATDRLAIGNGNTQSFVAVAPSGGGSVTIYKVDTTPDRTADAANSVTVVNGAAAGPPTFVRIGGNAAGPVIGGATAPDTLLVYTDDTNPESTDGQPDVRMTSYISGSYQPTTSMDFRNVTSDSAYVGTARAFFNEFGGTVTSVGSVAPSGGFGFVSQSWLERSGTSLIVRPLGAFTTQRAFDAAYNGTTNRVIIGSTSFGGIKSAQINATINRPQFPSWPAQATAGTGATTGGVSIAGLNSATVSDLALQPGSPTGMVAGLSHDGGDRVAGSVDGGANWFTLEARAGLAVDWWNAASGQWILSGTRGARILQPVTPENMLSAVNLATPAAFTTASATAPLSGTQSTDFGLIGSSAGARIRAIAGLSGTDKAAVAATMTTNFTLVQATLSVVTLSGSSASVLNLGAAFATGTAPVALAYCPAAGSAASVADKLFVAVAASAEGGTNGAIFTISAPGGAASINPPLAGATSGDFREIRVDCASGTAYAGGYVSAATDSGLMKATTTGGTLGSFTAVAIPIVTAHQHRIETLDINPGNIANVVAVSASGDVFVTTDGGATFQVVNNTVSASCVSPGPCGRAFGAQPPGDIEIVPAAADVPPADAPAAAVTPGQALFGSGAGLYAATVTPGFVPGAPGMPVNFQVLASGLALQLSWSPGSGAAPTGYVMQASTTSNFASIVYSQAVAGTSLALTAPPNTVGTFFLRVFATNAAGSGPATAGVSVTLPAATIPPPGAPGTPVVQVTSNARIILTWTAPSDPAAPTAYKAYLTFNGGPLAGSPFLLPGAATTVASPGALPNGSYTVAISAINIGGEGPQSAATSFIIGGPPGIPGLPQVTVNANGSIVVSWAPASGALTSYKAYVGLNSLPLPGSPFTLGLATAVSSPPLGAGSYTIAIAGVNGTAEGTPSPATAFTIGPPAAPGTPVVTVNPNRSVSVTWAASTGPVTTYRAYVTFNGATIPGSPFSLGAGTSVTSGPLGSGNYSLTLTALNALGESAQTAAVAFTIP